MLWQRLLFGALMIAAISGVVVFDGWLSANALSELGSGFDTGSVGAAMQCALPVTFVVLLLVVLSTYELGGLCRIGGFRPAVHWAVLIGAGLVIVPWIEMQQRIIPGGLLVPLLHVDISLTVLWLVGGLIGTCLLILMRKTTEQAIANLAVTMLIVLYIGLLGSFAVRIRCLLPGPAGAGLVVFFILTVKSGDIGAYFVGKAVGKHKLVPWLSPGKTVEGFVGALFVAGGASVGLTALWGKLDHILGPPPVNFSQALVFGAVMAIAGHLGDLVESVIKRDVGTKDSGRVVPAFGGLLDLVDSPVFAAPIAWWLLTFWG